MVAVDRLDDSNYIISLSPNSSLVGIYRIIFLASITFVCGGIATIIYFFGAALILPFAGIELTILFIAFYLSFRWSSKKEKIYISQEIVKIEKGIADHLGIKDEEFLKEGCDLDTKENILKESDVLLQINFPYQ